ncbi:hypothetical protein KQI63_14510 [bacterium]|nr:hypothetical protein [bacterium]
MHCQHRVHGVTKRFFLIAALFLITSPLMAHPLFVERYTEEAFDSHYLWLSSDSLTPPPGYMPLSTRFAAQFVENANERISGGYGQYLVNRYQLSFDTVSTVKADRSIWFSEFLFGRLMRLDGFASRLFNNRDHLFTYYDRKNNLEFGIDFIQRFDAILDERFKNDPFIIHTWGVESWANWKENWGAYVRFTDTIERGASSHRVVYGQTSGYRDIGEASLSYDQTQAYVGYANSFFSLRAGRSKHSWGPSYWNPLLLDHLHAPYPFIETQLMIGDKIRFLILHGELNAGPALRDTLFTTPEGNVRRMYPNKFIAGHRLELNPTNWVSIGLNEAVIYGERSAEIGYLLPMNLYWSEGHHQDYDDNVLWNADIRVKPIRSLMLYGEFLLDEANLGAFGSEEFGNRTAYTVGSRWIGLPRQDIRIEYTKVRPFVFTHWFPINRPTTWDRPLATYLPPNSDEWHVQWRWYAQNHLWIELFASGRRHGATPEGEPVVGGARNETVRSGGNEGIFPFLDGVREDSREVGIAAHVQALERAVVEVQYARGSDVGKDYSFALVRVAYNFWTR